MAERLRVTANGRAGYEYPVGADAVRVAEVGGLSQLPEDELRAIVGYWDEDRKVRVPSRLKRVEPGDWCDDMPPSTVAIYLERGWIERVPVVDSAPRAAAAPKSEAR